MTSGARAAIMLATGAAMGTLIGGCGSSSKAVSATIPVPTVSQPIQTATQTPPAHTTSTPTATTPATPNGGTPGPSTTRSAPEPAFAQQGASAGEGVSAAMALVQAKGYTVKDPGEYHAAQTLQVLVGTRLDTGDAYAQQAFFFADGHFLGTDAKQASAMVHVVSQSDTEVTLQYTLYRPSDALCCPGGGHASVSFALNDGTLAALGPIPPASSSTGLSRQ